MLTLIVAVNKKGTIGVNGWMPWNVPEDLKFFKKTTLNHKVVFGRTTFDGFKKLLPQREILVVTSKSDLDHREDIHVIHDFDAFLKYHQASEEEIFIAGGASIYHKALPYCKKMFISEIDNDLDGDTYFPKFDQDDFIKTCIHVFEGFRVYQYLRKDHSK